MPFAFEAALLVTDGLGFGVIPACPRGLEPGFSENRLASGRCWPVVRWATGKPRCVGHTLNTFRAVSKSQAGF
ncbi:hypothetical protein LPB72_17510 [Hydrogenophaga crassostreae]|uniref:LysR substrate-binding domain-containing protein n=1 Tax=Hydrogenophaga crassostreae TaxID=1763535 RepID=A0A162SSL5_9BURK|nr:hypothetical protein LPB072_08015 [Hydrogenophaga crassostreae]OAD39984.1 hypothetical protein LPB72_17510 [Hydrogenophaga crassostreae]